MDHDRTLGIIIRDRVTNDLHLDYPHPMEKHFPSSRDGIISSATKNHEYFEILDLWREVRDRHCNRSRGNRETEIRSIHIYNEPN